MKNKNIIPLDITNKISEKYPNVWEQVEHIRNSRDSVLEKWDDHCYIPIAYAIAIASQGKEITSDKVLDGAIIAAVAPWRLYKQIYEFDPDMENVLLNQDKEDLVIPIEILKTLPYQSIYIKTSYDDYDGFFVYFESDYNTKEFELRILLCGNDGSIIPCSMHLYDGATIKDGVNKAAEEVLKNGSNTKFAECYSMIMQDIFSKLIHLILYLCANNKEITEDPKQKTITKIPTERKYIKDKFREIRMWNCGVTTGSIIRKINNNKKVYQSVNTNKNSSIAVGTPKRPHSRKGHWRHFWIGKRDTEERKLVLKWVAPMFIHAGLNSEIITINNVQKDAMKE